MWKDVLDDIFEKANLIMHFPWMLTLLNALPDGLAGPVIGHHRVSLFISFLSSFSKMIKWELCTPET